MFDFVHKHKRMVQFVLALITLPFAFFGVDYYFHRGDSTPEVARVGSDKITQQEFAESIREQQDRMRQTMGANYDPAMFDNPEVRYALLDQLISQRILRAKAREESLRVSDGQLQDVIASIPAFQDNGKFSVDRYKQLLAMQNLTPPVFEERMRQDLVLSPLQEPIAGGAIVARASSERFLGLLEQQREVSVATLDAEPPKPASIDDAAAKAFFDANGKVFQTPEQAKFEYVILNQDALAGQVQLDPNEVKAYYDTNARQFGAGEQRTASHILIAVKPDASAADKAAAKKKADDLTAQVKANPGKFAELARQFSQDPGSAAQGGSLGSFGRGTMVKPFDEAVFSMKVADIAGPVQSDFGYHVIRLDAITPARIRPFDEVKGQIESDLKRQKASQAFAKAADQFQNLVYEQADSLQGVGKALNVPVQTSQLVTRAQAQALAQGNAKFVEALFGPDSAQSKRNTEAIEIGPNVLMAGRIVDYRPAAPLPFEQVKDQIKRQLAMRASSDAAQKAGAEKLAQLAQGHGEKDSGLVFGKAQPLTRNQVQPGFPPDALRRVFQADAAKLPQYVGAMNERGGYSIYRVSRVTTPPATDAAKVTAAGARIGDQLGRELLQAYVASLKSRTEVTINQANLEKK